MTGLRIRRMSGQVGAELDGVSLSALDDDDFARVRDALFAHGVIVFREQTLTPEQHMAFAERFGDIDVNRFFTPVAAYPRIAEVRTEPHQHEVIGASWHTDHSYDPVPAMASILVAREVPEHGGDTLFASMTAAHDALSPGLREMLSGLRAWHSDGSFARAVKDGRLSDTGITQPNLHPVIIRHPHTGARAVYVNGDFTTHFEDWTEEESAPLLAWLYRFVTRAEFCCRLRWAPGTVAMWDNRLVQHLAVADYAGQRRLMHRVTVAGQALE